MKNVGRIVLRCLACVAFVTTHANRARAAVNSVIGYRFGENVLVADSGVTVTNTTNLEDLEYPATPRYGFTDTNAPAVPQRYYRLRWP